VLRSGLRPEKGYACDTGAAARPTKVTLLLHNYKILNKQIDQRKRKITPKLEQAIWALCHRAAIPSLPILLLSLLLPSSPALSTASPPRREESGDQKKRGLHINPMFKSCGIQQFITSFKQSRRHTTPFLNLGFKSCPATLSPTTVVHSLKAVRDSFCKPLTLTKKRVLLRRLGPQSGSWSSRN
jgi:hypothetical protein